ncbi:FAD-binding oxidoreductase, partial [Mesorhizobium sp. M4B.F.Ca.ET.203.01.1.1]|uniref:FAD-dependent oxidoreductase n=1 Tax=Mesorhizobium sp. M4B.F.Ca.ET.203.01.1.1 TaxID=2563953 RepID=UPI0010937EC6
NPYLYMRATADARVICGGEEEDFIDEERRDALMAKKTRRLEEKLGRVFPQLHTEAAFAWSGSFGATSTGLPTIGSVPGHARIHAVVGYGGAGLQLLGTAGLQIDRNGQPLGPMDVPSDGDELR